MRAAELAGRVENHGTLVQQELVYRSRFRYLYGDDDEGRQYPESDAPEQQRGGQGSGEHGCVDRRHQRSVYGDGCGGERSADGDADGDVSGCFGDVHAATEPVGIVGAAGAHAERGFVHKQHADRSGERCVHGVADRSGNGRNCGESGEQRQRGDGAGVGDDRGGSFECRDYSNGRGGELESNGDTDRECGRRVEDDGAAAGRDDRGAEPE